MSDKTAIITGVSSFVGCHLAQAFFQAGWSVVAVISRPKDTYDGIRAERLEYIQDNVTFVVCDLTDARAVEGVIDAHAPNLWVQHAGFADNYASPNYDLGKSLALNVVALEPIYRCLTGTGCGVIVTGSSMEYASSTEPNHEDDVCWPELPYGVSKLAETVEAYRLCCQYDVPTRVVRLYIPVGAYDAPGKLMDFVIKQLLAGDAAALSPCIQKRDFLSVEDISIAYVRLADDMGRQAFDIFNICSGEARELKALLMTLAEIIGADTGLLDFGARPMREGEAMVSVGDNSKAQAILNWHPRPIEDILKSLIELIAAAK